MHSPELENKLLPVIFSDHLRMTNMMTNMMTDMMTNIMTNIMTNMMINTVTNYDKVTN